MYIGGSSAFTATLYDHASGPTTETVTFTANRYYGDWSPNESPYEGTRPTVIFRKGDGSVMEFDLVELVRLVNAAWECVKPMEGNK